MSLNYVVKCYGTSICNCKGIIANIIDKIELSKIENKEKISMDEILENIKEVMTLIRSNLEKIGKNKYHKYNNLTGNIIEKK